MQALEICDSGAVFHSPWIEFWEGDDREAARIAIDAARRGDMGRFTGYFATALTKRSTWWDVVITPIRDREGKPEQLLAVCLLWYLRYSLSYRNLEEMMAERGLKLNHSTIARWALQYAPVLNERIRSEMWRPNRSWRVKETTFVWREAGPIYIGPSTRPGIPSTFCFHLNGISQPPKASFGWRPGRRARIGHA